MSIFKRKKVLTAVSEDNSQPFHSLSPIGDAEIKQYEDGLLWALRNRKQEDIKNVALTGPYGSGKSSILKTFQNRFENEFKFLNLSLATFKEELEASNNEESSQQGVDTGKTDDEGLAAAKDKPGDTEVLRLIELSILQQIFYHEEDKTIPDSRFKKIRSFKRSNLMAVAGCMLLLLLCGFNLFAPEKFKQEFHLKLSSGIDLALHMTCLVLMLTGAYIILLRSVRLLNSIKVSKLKIHDTEIEVDKGISKSILNSHLDEILYFFEVTQYTVVIIEDLDRFQQTEIFTKLRELNLLINNSKKIKRDIVFIYAVRDDMFRDKDRTKFFDFIVPVIPVINSSNSNDMLREVIKANKYPISEVLVDDVSYFIDDMRLLYNIVNEYYIYHERLDKKLSQDKLLAMVVYKNIHPNDFVRLSEDKGELYKVIKSKMTYIKTVQERIDKEIAMIRERLLLLEANKLKEVAELRKIYVMQYLTKLTNFMYFNSNAGTITLETATSEANFEKFQTDEMLYTYLYHNHSNYYSSQTTNLPQTFVEVQKAVDTNQTYEERLNLVRDWGKAKSDALKLKIATLELEKSAARHLKLTDLINAGDIKVLLGDAKQNLLINILLRNGYIEEDYSEFTSIFYEGSITKADRQYLLNVKSQMPLDFDFTLKNIDKLIEKINPVDFGKDYILNYQLLDFLLASNASAYQHQRTQLLHLLALETERSYSFIDGYIDNGKQIEKFIKLLYQEWSGFWPFISGKSNYIDERKSIYFELIIAHADNKDIIASATNNGLFARISESSNFLSLAVDAEKLKSLIAGLKIKFTQLDLVLPPKALADYVIDGYYYKLSATMLSAVLRYHEKYNQPVFEQQNYDSIQDSGLPQLIAYVQANMQVYMDEVFLKLAQNTLNSQASVVSILNNESVSSSSKEAVIERMTIQLDSLQPVDAEFHLQLLEGFKIKPTWENVIFWYHENDDELYDTGVNFISNDNNISALAKVRVNIKLPEDELATVRKFLRALLAEDSFEMPVYEQLISNLPFSYDSLELEGVTPAKVSLLIVKNVLNLTVGIFNYLKANFSPLHIALLTRKPAEFVGRLSEFELDDNDLLLLLQSDNLPAGDKKTIYDSIQPERISAQSPLAKPIGQLLIHNPNWTIGNLQLINILRSALSLADSIKLFNMRFETFDKDEVTQILQSWPSPYAEIAINGKRPLLGHGQENSFFANNLKMLKYISKVDSERRGIRISTFLKK